jgi:hypothetical protein
MGLLDVKSRKSVTGTAPGLFTEPRREPSAKPTAPVIRTTDADPDPTRIGLTLWNEDEPFLHYCQVCGAWGSYGFDVDLLKDRLGRWYCLKHKPEA